METVQSFLNIDVVEYECCVCKTFDHTLCGVIGCMHPICILCIDKCKKNGNYECPICRNKCSSYETNYVLNRQRNNILVKCPNECTEKVFFCDYSTHLSSCPLSFVNCQINECEWGGIRKDYYEHIKQCPFIKVECMYCKNRFYKECISPHEEMCKNYYEMVDCEKCDTKVMKWNVKYHKCDINKSIKLMEEPTRADIYMKTLTEESFIDLLVMIFIEETKYGINKTLKKNIKTLTTILWCIDYFCNTYYYEDDYNDLVITYINMFWSCIYQRHQHIKEEIVLKILEEKDSRFLSKDRYFYADKMKTLIRLESSL